MPEQTSKLGIKKPLGNETVSRAAFNENWDIIDQNVQKNIIQSATAPSEPIADDLWIDTSTTPYGLKKWDGAAWQKIGAVTPGDIGAETPAGAQAKAEAAAGAVQAELDAHLAETVKNNVHGLKTTDSVTIYVDATSGNDANPGTQSQPLKTIGAAVGKITNLIIDSDHAITIQLAPGTYVENVRIKNLHGAGTFYLRGGSNLAEADNYVIDGWVAVAGCTCVTYIHGIKVLGSSNWEGVISFYSCLSGRVSFCKVDKTGRINSTYNYGISVGAHSLVIASNNDISNITGGSVLNVAIQCFETSRVFSVNNTGNNNSIGLRASAGTIMKNGSQPSGTTAELATNGGVIR